MRTKAIILLLALSFVMIPFAGCNGSAAPPEASGGASPAPSSQEAAPPSSATEEPVDTAGGIKGYDSVYEDGPGVTMRLATLSLADQGGAVIKARVSEFLRLNPNVTLNIEEYPGNDIIPAINTAIMADNCPDVFLFFRPEAGWNVPAYAEAGALADLTELISSPAFEGVFPAFALRTASQINGVYYCVPRISYYDEFLVNKTVFEAHGIALPDTWENLMAAVPALKEAGIIPWQNTTAELLDSSSRLFFNILNRQVGNEKALALMGGAASWLDEDVFPALDYFVTLAAGNGPPDQNALNQAQSIAKYLSTGQAAMLLENNGGNTNIDPAVIPDLIAMEFPVIPGGVETEPTTEKDVTNLVYASAKEYANADKKPCIDNLIMLLANQQAAKQYLEQAGQIVPHLGLEIDETFIIPLNKQAMEIAEKQPGNKWLLSYVSADNRSTFRDLCNEVWYGSLTAEQYRDALQKGLYGKPN